MTEAEFRARFKTSFLEAYQTSLRGMVDFGEVTPIDELLTTINERATIAWKQYLKDTGNQK